MPERTLSSFGLVISRQAVRLLLCDSEHLKADSLWYVQALASVHAHTDFLRRLRELHTAQLKAEIAHSDLVCTPHLAVHKPEAAAQEGAS